MAPRHLRDLEFWIRAALFFTLLSLVLSLLATTVAEPDLWGYLPFGRLFWQSQKFPYRDVFAYVPTLNP